MQSSAGTWNYTYNSDGMRIGRTNGTDTYTYWYDGNGRLLRMKYNDIVMSFSYGASGQPMSITYDGTVYYYLLNAQGDVVGLIDSTGNLVVQYTYDAWGRLLSTTGTAASALGINNPLRYRGYVYDTETGLYYLETRYYNPTLGRFINVDGCLFSGYSCLGYNMLAYCLNNPVNMLDTTGFSPLYYSDVWEEIMCTEAGRMYASAGNNSLNQKGEPNSIGVLYNPDGSVKQKRWYGQDGVATRDRDYNHAGNMDFPHDHEWKDGKRNEDHLPPSPDYEFSVDPFMGVCIVSLCSITAVAIMADNVTGIGIADDSLLVPLGQTIWETLKAIFR